MEIVQKKLSRTILAIAIAALVFTGCKKNEKFENIMVSQTAQDNSAAEEQFDDAKSTANDVASNQAFATSLARTDDVSQVTGNYGCANVTITPSGTGKKMIIDFGTGCIVNSETGKTKKGKIIVTTTGPYLSVGTVITTTFDNYYVNDVKVDGIHTSTNTTTNPSQPQFTIKVRDARLTFPDNTTRTWTADRVRTWVSGFGDGILFNDVIEITGGSSGTNRSRENYTSVITSKLVVKTECWKSRIFKPVSGIITLNVGTNVGTIDYGSGTCDNSFVITINSRTYNISRN